MKYCNPKRNRSSQSSSSLSADVAVKFSKGVVFQLSSFAGVNDP